MRCFALPVRDGARFTQCTCSQPSRHAGDRAGRSCIIRSRRRIPRRRNFSIRACASFTRSTTTKRRARFNMRRTRPQAGHGLLGRRRGGGAELQRSAPIPTVSSRRMMRCRRQWNLSAGASPSEQAYIQAMAKRFPADPNSDLKKAAEEYHDAMRQVAARVSRRPGRRHALRRGRHEPASLGTVASGRHARGWYGGNRRTLESVIEARSESPRRDSLLHPHRGGFATIRSARLAGANRLATLAPGAGHIVHMPAHIYIRTGDYEAAGQDQ